jgi:hypothetical protein
VKIVFPPAWVQTKDFEKFLSNSLPHESPDTEVVFTFPSDCKVPIHIALMMLSLFNQLSYSTRRVILEFEDVHELYGYLNRMAFFERLAPEVEVKPRKPGVSSASVYGGTNETLVEIHEAPLGGEMAARNLPSLLKRSLMQNLAGNPKAATIGAHVGTVLTELLGNIYQHSDTPIPGFVALQPYINATPPKVTLAISDSGHGLTETLRRDRPKDFIKKTDLDVILTVFREGASRFGPVMGRGGGLKRCAEIAIKYKAILHTRVPSTQITLHPAGNVYERNTAVCLTDRSLLWGTHICFEFLLTTS